MKKKFPFAWFFGALAFTVLLVVFLARKAAITGGVTTGGGINAITVTPVSSGMITIAAVAALILIVIFAGIGKTEH